MTLRHLRIFAEVCRLGSVTEAANALYMTQPAVSLAIRELETHYGLRLFDRTGRKLTVTGDGKRLLEYAIHIVALFDDMELALKNPDAMGELRVGSSLTIGACLLPGYLDRLKDIAPRLRVKVVVDNSESVIQAVAGGRLDVGLVEGSVGDETLVALPFMKDSLIAVCGGAHPFSRRAQVPLSEFLAEPLLVRERGSGVRELVESALALWGVPCDPLWESASTTALIHALEAGHGVSILPEKLVADAIAAGRLCAAPVPEAAVRRSFYLIYHRKKYLSAGIRRLIELVTGTAETDEP